MSDPHFVPQPFAPTLPAGISHKRLLLASFLSAGLPGAGHFLVNRRRKGALLLAVFCVLLLLCWPLRLPSRFWGVVPLVFGMLVLCIFAVWDVPYGGKQRSDKPSQWWLAFLLPLGLLAAVIHCNWSTRASGFQTFVMPSKSMENTVVLGKQVMVDRWYYHEKAPGRREIIVLINSEGIYFMKRVIALGGDTIEGKNGEILIDGKPLREPYAIHMGGAPPELNNFGPTRIPPGKLFVMGDNRDVSIDSRMPEFGLVDTTAVRGRALYTLPSPWDGSYKLLE